MCEIEFYLDCEGHNDTFTHGDPMQKLNCKWYFHKMFGSYKAGSYKGLDVSFGKPELPAIGGCLLRSLMPVTVTEKDGKIHVTNPGSKDLFIEGPCNCVNKILAETTGSKEKGIKDVVSMDEFNLDIFDKKSNFHLVTNVVMPTREVVKCPRVGLSLKKMDE